MQIYCANKQLGEIWGPCGSIMRHFYFIDQKKPCDVFHMSLHVASYCSGAVGITSFHFKNLLIL